MFTGPAPSFVKSLCGYCLWPAELNELKIFENCCNVVKDISLKPEQCVVLWGSCRSSRCEVFGSCAKM